MSKNYEHILAYLDNELSAEERAAFEKRLASEPPLVAEMDLLKEAQSHIAFQLKEEQAIADFQSHLQKAMQEDLQDKPPSFIKRYGLYITIAAAAIALLIIFWPGGSESLYRQYAQHPQLALTERSTDSEALASDATEKFNAGQYATAFDLLNDYNNYHPNDPEIILFQGICLLEMGQAESAITYFNQLHESKVINRYEGTWYLALTYLYISEQEAKQTNLDRVVSLLEEIPQNSEYYEEAQALLGEL